MSNPPIAHELSGFSCAHTRRGGFEPPIFRLGTDCSIQPELTAHGCFVRRAVYKGYRQLRLVFLISFAREDIQLAAEK